jgi:hypothetical protein
MSAHPALLQLPVALSEQPPNHQGNISPEIKALVVADD